MGDEDRTYIRYGKQDGKAHLVDGPAHPGGPSLCGLGADDMEDGIQLASGCDTCFLHQAELDAEAAIEEHRSS